jgi:hypothetical protein
LKQRKGENPSFSLENSSEFHWLSKATTKKNFNGINALRGLPPNEDKALKQLFILKNIPCLM